MSYTEIGFNEFLQRVESASTGGDTQQLDVSQSDTYLPQVSGSKVQGGVIASPDGRMSIDLDTGTFIINDGTQELVRLGVLPDGSIGLLIKDSAGNILQQVSGSANFIQSAQKHLLLDFIKENISVFNEAGIRNIILGDLDNV